MIKVNSSDRDLDKLLTVAELSSFLNVHTWTIRRWVKTGRITAYGLGRVIRFDKTEVLKSLNLNANNEADRYGSLKNRLRQKASRK